MIDEDWKSRAVRLASQLAESGALRSPQWRAAVAGVPRHLLVEVFYTQNSDGTWTGQDSSGDSGAYLDAVYSDQTLVTALAEYHARWGVGHIAVSSSTAPGLMVSMLEALDVRDGDTVLEIGTGSGYNAALLAHALGAGNVYSVDIDADLVERAAARLARIGYRPTLVAHDGAEGLARHAPYDGILATCSVPAIPRAWIEQTRCGGTILTDLKVGGMEGNLVRLRRDGDGASGRFLPDWAGFMTMRHGNERNDTERPSQPHRIRADATPRRSTAPAEPWTQPVPWFLAQFTMPANLTYGQNIDDETGEPGDIFLSAPNGSWCEVGLDTDRDGTRHVVEHGPTPLWRLWESAHGQWRTLGQPAWPRFGLTVHADDGHTVWLDEPAGDQQWHLAR
ncbi:methyltransferase domain-containing protein [Actinokineospora sp.]|uniref:methyltransferase domain-containing protein n=1 Tax=Actinokineospora sp. TaxID=1872133 RepID=UPI0040381667